MKYKIKFPARCPRHYRHLMGKRHGHCAQIYAHTGDHQFPNTGWERAPWFKRMMRSVNPTFDRPF